MWIEAHESPVVLYASPMRRAIETAEPIAARLGCPVRVDPRLSERMNWEGPEHQSLEEFLAEWDRAIVDRAFHPTSGDSSIEAAERFLDLLGERADAHSGTVVAVTHGGVTVDLLRTIVGDDWLSALAPDLIDLGVPCCGITRLRLGDGRWDVESVAVTSHLEGSTDSPLT